MIPLPPTTQFIKLTDGRIRVNYLNIAKNYQGQIRWNDQKHGKLWNYHLQYGDFLKQSQLTVEDRRDLILDLYSWLENGKLKPEPYPASLRIMNVIRFLSEIEREKFRKDSKLVEYLFSELHFLENRLEYHLLGNHLMENAFALLMGGIAFNNKKWIHTAEEIFAEQIPEQILEDGAHFERSPMYHTIILFRFIEALYYLPANFGLHPVFWETCRKMLSWIEQVSFKNGDMANFNDSTNGQTFTKDDILNIAEKAGILDLPKIRLSDSGYRKFKNENFELLINSGGIAPTYQPGHAHADSLSFILHINNKPFIVDPGVSTYEEGEQRNWERSTSAHNTVTYQNRNTADVWGQFRVGRRPEVRIENEKPNQIRIRLTYILNNGEHFEHTRSLIFSKSFIEIEDVVNIDSPVEGRLHLHPLIEIKSVSNKTIEFNEGYTLYFDGPQNVSHFAYDYCSGFNHRIQSKGIEYSFLKKSSFKIIAHSK